MIFCGRGDSEGVMHHGHEGLGRRRCSKCTTGLLLYDRHFVQWLTAYRDRSEKGFSSRSGAEGENKMS